MATSSAYHRVSVAAEDDNDDSIHNRNRNVKQRVNDKIAALVWITAAALLAWMAGVQDVLFSPNSKAVRPLMRLVFICFGINTVFLLYLVLYLPKVKGLVDSSAWDVYCPRVVPSMTLVGVLATILLIRACWPVWGFLTPLILGVEALGAIHLLHFVPFL